MKFIYKKAFTLVELIIVITILAVLATVAFISYSGYSMQARDSVRLADIKTVYFGLNYYQTKNSKVPESQNYTEIQISGSTISRQSDLGIEVLNLIGMGSDIFDPKTAEKYTYVTDNNNINFQVAGFLEIDDPGYAFSNNVYANHENLFYSKGAYLGVIKNNSGNLIHKEVPTFNLNNETSNLTAYFSRGNIFQGTGPELVAELQK